MSIRTPRTFYKTKRLQVQVCYFLECIVSIFSHDMIISWESLFFYFLMPCNALGSGGYYQNRASVRQIPVMPTASVITLHTTLIPKCTGGRFVQFYWEMARPFYFSLEATDAAI